MLRLRMWKMLMEAVRQVSDVVQRIISRFVERLAYPMQVRALVTQMEWKAHAKFALMGLSPAG